MYPLHLNRNEQSAYNAALVGIAQTKRIRVSLLDRSGDSVADLSGGFMGGSVQVDGRGDVMRTATFDILDPFHRFGFDADTYQGGDLDLTRLIRAFWTTDSALMTNHVTVPVFTGPATRLTRRGPVVTIEAQSKEVYGLGRGGRTLTIKKGARKTDAIRTILTERMGETRMAIPELSGRLSAQVVVRPKDQAWKAARKIAQSMGKQLFYDAAGVARLREPPSKVAWKFGAGESGSLLTEPETSADLTTVINQVKVTGRTPKGKKDPVSAVATADKGHPLSPSAIGAPGAPLVLQKEVQNDHCRTNAECLKVARTHLAVGLNLARTVAFDAVPIPWLEPLDLIAVATEFEAARTRVEQFTLPLGLEGAMQVGYDGPYRLRKTRRPRRPRTRDVVSDIQSGNL